MELSEGEKVGALCSPGPGASTYSPSLTGTPTYSPFHYVPQATRPKLLFWRYRGKYGGLDTELEA